MKETTKATISPELRDRAQALARKRGHTTRLVIEAALRIGLKEMEAGRAATDS